MSSIFPLVWDSVVNGFYFFFQAFSPLFNQFGSLSFIPFFLFIYACFGALTCILGLIGSGISAIRSR